MKKFWFEFDLQDYVSPPPGVKMGCGITARTIDQAKEMLTEVVFKGKSLPQISVFKEDVDISSLDLGHVLPNMGSPLEIGVWFPLGYR